MKISTRSRYGLRALAYLANKGRRCSVKEIAQKEEIPFDYLEKLFLELKRAKLVKVKRGPQGGYHLAHSPHKISVGEIIQALEGTTVLVSCLTQKGKRYFPCPRGRICLAKSVWAKVQDAWSSSLKSFTLADAIQNE